MKTQFKEKIALLLKKKHKNDELERCLDLYEKIDEYLNDKPSILDKIRTTIKPISGDTTHCLNIRRTDMIDRTIEIGVNCTELLYALRDYYERKIYELTEYEE